MTRARAGSRVWARQMLSCSGQAQGHYAFLVVILGLEDALWQDRLIMRRRSHSSLRTTVRTPPHPNLEGFYWKTAVRA